MMPRNYVSKGLLAVLAAAAMAVPYTDAAGRQYVPAPRGRKREERPHRNGTFTRTGAVARRRNAWIQRQRAEERTRAAFIARWDLAMPSAANATHGGAS